MKDEDYVVRVESELEALRLRIEAIAEDYRVHVLVPLCRRRRLSYRTGNGRTVFYKKDGTSAGADWEAEIEGMDYLKEVFAVLNTPVLGTNDCLGYYVADIG